MKTNFTKILSLVLSSAILFTMGTMFSTIASAQTIVTTNKAWDFKNNIDGWSYGDSWEYQYNGKNNTSISYDNEKLKINVDYSADSAESWSQMAVCYNESDMSLKNANYASFDFYYETAKLTKGSFGVGIFSNCGIDNVADINNAAVDIGNGISKATVEFDYSNVTDDLASDLTIKIIGFSTDYKGSIWLDNIVVTNKYGSQITMNGTSVPEPTYTVTIPEKIDFGTCNKAMKNDIVANRFKTVDIGSVTVNHSNLYINEKEIEITIGSNFKITDGTDSLNYSILKDGKALVTGEKIATVSATQTDLDVTQSTPLTASLDKSQITKNSTTYTGTVSFTVTLAEK